MSLAHITSVKSCLDSMGSAIRKRFKILGFFPPKMPSFQAPGKLCQCSSTFPSAVLHKSAVGKAGENDSPGDIK